MLFDLKLFISYQFPSLSMVSSPFHLPPLTSLFTLPSYNHVHQVHGPFSVLSGVDNIYNYHGHPHSSVACGFGWDVYDFICWWSNIGLETTSDFTAKGPWSMSFCGHITVRAICFKRGSQSILLMVPSPLKLPPGHLCLAICHQWCFYWE